MTPVIRLASRRAAPPSPMPTVQGTPDPIQLNAEAHNALAAAGLGHLRLHRLLRQRCGQHHRPSPFPRLASTQGRGCSMNTGTKGLESSRAGGLEAAHEEGRG